MRLRYFAVIGRYKWQTLSFLWDRRWDRRIFRI